jgi:AcrR family transcriptional regulator
VSGVSDVVKRDYHSPKRAAQAAATRAEIAEAARQLFLEHGYTATTLAEIAARAGVSLPTVKLAYGTKRQILMAAWDLTVKGMFDERPAAAMSNYQDMLAEPDPLEQLRTLAAMTSRIRPRLALMNEVFQAAAASDPEIAEQVAKMGGEYWENQHTVIKALHRKAKLRTGLTEKTATDLLFTLNGGAVFKMLVIDLGWSLDNYREWLSRTLVEQLLEPS